MRTIQLTQGKVALVDDEDYDELIKFKWHAHNNKNTYYATRMANVGVVRRKVFMHNFILAVKDNNTFIDHKDRDGLNNQKCNLRIATRGQNLYNRKMPDGTSKFKGVTLHRGKYKQSEYLAWQAEIQIEKEKYYIGRFKTEEAAALAYNKKAIELQGEFAYLNTI